MNPVAIFFIVFFLGLIGGATAGLEFALTTEAHVTLGDVFLVALLAGLVSASLESPRVQSAVTKDPGTTVSVVIGLLVILMMGLYIFSAHQ